MSNEIIQSVAYNNYDYFQHDNFIFLHKFSFHYFENYIYNDKTDHRVRYGLAIYNK
jgi:hypothetical protein